MVTNLKEGSKTKCEQYWPESCKEPTTFGPFNVTLVGEQVLPDIDGIINRLREQRMQVVQTAVSHCVNIEVSLIQR